MNFEREGDPPPPAADYDANPRISRKAEGELGKQGDHLKFEKTIPFGTLSRLLAYAYLGLRVATAKWSGARCNVI